MAKKKRKASGLQYTTTKEALTLDDVDASVPRLDMTSPKEEAEGLKMRKRGQPFVALKVPVFLTLAKRWTLEHLNGARNSYEHVIVQRYTGNGFTFCGSENGTGYMRYRAATVPAALT